jgi:hypothetical protein
VASGAACSQEEEEAAAAAAVDQVNILVLQHVCLRLRVAALRRRSHTFANFVISR